MHDFKVNEYITLKLEEKNTVIYVANVRFQQCKYLLLSLPVEKITMLDDIQSIDEAAEKLDNSLEPMSSPQNDIYTIDIPPEAGYWAHCSNLQTWAENNYNTNLLHSNLAFPLLKKLVEAGDKTALKVFKEEIAKRLESGYLPTIKYLWNEGFIKYLSYEELSIIPNFKYKELRYLLKIEELTKARFIWSDDKEEAFETKAWFNVSEGHISELEIDYKPNMCIFPEPITNLRFLTDLSMIENSIKSIPNTIDNLHLLRYLDLTGNKLVKLPETLGKCKTLEFLRLGGNSISELPQSIGNLTLLKQLELYNNSISILPDSIGKLINLKRLDLEGNKLERLPTSIQNLQSIESLDLQKNELNAIPEFIGNVKSLRSLSVSGNKLENLESLSNLNDLNYIGIDKNQFEHFSELIQKLEKKINGLVYT